jgi:hypothetical protein
MTPAKPSVGFEINIKALTLIPFVTAGTIYHELAHTQGMNEAQAREAELKFYVELANKMNNKGVIDPTYLENNVVVYDEKLKAYAVDQVALDSFVARLQQQADDLQKIKNRERQYGRYRIPWER